MNPYKILGINENASEDEIKSAYRTMAKKYHPDLNPGDASAHEKFLEIQKAYDDLTNKKSQNSYTGGNKQWSYNFNDVDDDFIRRMFEELRRQKEERKQHIQRVVNLSLSDAHNGTKWTINVDGETHSVEIPEGVVNGSHVNFKLTDKLEITLIVQLLPTDEIAIDHNQLIYTHKISATDFNTLNSIEVKNHIGKKYMVKLKENMNTHSFLRVPNGGLFDKQRNIHHDLYIRFVVYRDAKTVDNKKGTTENEKINTKEETNEQNDKKRSKGT